MKLSVIIPSYKDPYLNKTVESLLENSELEKDELEIICVMDGYWQSPIDDERVNVVHLGKNRGMRGAINAGIAIAKGEYFMRLDEHVKFSKGFDKVLTDLCGEKDIVTARRYFLDPEKWEVMEDKGYIDCEKMVIQDMGNGVRKFSGQKWKSRAEKYKNKSVIEAEAQQGSCWVANRKFFLETVGELDTEHYGPLIQDSVEVQFKYWMAGGKLLFTKDAWYAHKFREFARTHNNGTSENPAQYEKGYAFAMSQFEDYYNKVVVLNRDKLVAF